MDVIVVGAGIIGAACAEALSRRGLRVAVVDQGSLAGGTSASGEGNVLVSDKEPGPELTLALASRARWPALLAELRDELGPRAAEVEWDPKGGLVVVAPPAATGTRSGEGTAAADALERLADAQRAAGVAVSMLSPEEVAEREPHLTRRITAGAYYPDDAQLQPVLATTTLLAAVRRRGGELYPATRALGVDYRPDGAVVALRTDRGRMPCDAIVAACGPWAAAFGDAADAPLPVLPRRGMVLVTAAVPAGTVRHKVYDADYVGSVASGDAELMTSTVVEATRAGTILIGSSREHVGFDDTTRVAVLRAIARKAVALFPTLAEVPVMRAYGGFRPYVPDHLPVIGPDPRHPGLWHATGHEGAGIGLAAATGRLLAELFTGEPPHVDASPFRVDRPSLAPEAVSESVAP